MATRRKTRKKATPKTTKPREGGIRKKAKSRRPAKRGPGTGQPPFKPSGDQRKQVELMQGIGMTYKEIATVTLNPTTGKGISVTTLQEHFRDELDVGGPVLKRQVVGALYKKATGDGPQSVAAAIFLCKTRYGMRETQVVEHTGHSGVLVAPASQTPQEWIEEQQRLNEDRVSPVTKKPTVNGTNGRTNGTGHG